MLETDAGASDSGVVVQQAFDDASDEMRDDESEVVVGRVVDVGELSLEDQIYFTPSDHKNEYKRASLFGRRAPGPPQAHGKRHAKDRGDRRHDLHPALMALLILLGAVVVLAASAGITLAVAINRGNVNLHKLFDAQTTTIADANVHTEVNGEIVEWKGQTWRYNPHIASFVVIDHDDESSMGYGDRSLADTIVLVTLDTSTNKARATMVPRNTWCAVDLYDEKGAYADTNEMRITLSRGVTLPTQQGCAANTVRSVAHIFYDMPVTYFFDFGSDVVARAADAVGGVDLEALEYIPGVADYVGQELHLTGKDAYRYVSYRLTDKDEGALDRQERQVQFIRAFAAKLSGLGANDLLKLYQDLSDGVVTNLGVSEVAYLTSCLATGDTAKLELASLKGTTKVGREADGIEYERYYLDDDSVMENTLAAFYEPIDEEAGRGAADESTASQ